MEYTLKITEKQAAVLSRATELLARLGMGQIDDALRALPISNFNGLGETERAILQDLATRHGMRRPSIASHETNDEAQIAWDLYQVLRHRLAWDRASASGLAGPRGTRKMPKMAFVYFDEPLHTGPEPLAKIEKAVEGC